MVQWHNTNISRLDVLEHDLTALNSGATADNIGAVSDACIRLGTDADMNYSPMPDQAAQDYFHSALLLFKQAAVECQNGIEANDSNLTREAGATLAQGTTNVQNAVDLLTRDTKGSL